MKVATLKKISYFLENIRKNFIYTNELGVLSFEVITHNIIEGFQTFSSSNIDFALETRREFEKFSINGSKTIRASNGHEINIEKNPNAQRRTRHLKTKEYVVNNIIITIITEAHQHGYFEIAITSLHKIKDIKQLKCLQILFKKIQNSYYLMIKGVEKYKMQNQDEYNIQHQKDLKKIIDPSDLGNKLNFNHYINENVSLTPIQLKIIAGLSLGYDNQEFQQNFGIKKNTKNYNLTGIKNKLKLNQDCKISEILKKCRNNGVLSTIENIIQYI